MSRKSKAQAHEYLMKIESNDLIDLDKFERVMIKNGVPFNILSDTFEKESGCGIKVRLKITNQSYYESLLKKFPSPINVVDRISAAAAGDTHLFSVKGNMLITQKADMTHPFVAMTKDDDSWTPLPELGSHLVISENMQNFINFEQTLSFLKKNCGYKEQSNLYLAFGSGNAATKACSENYYKHFKSVGCLFDLDAGGLKMYGSLKKLLHPHNITPTFVIPNDIRERLETSRRRLNTKELIAIHHAKETHPELAWVLKCMISTKRRLEQEDYIT